MYSAHVSEQFQTWSLQSENLMSYNRTSLCVYRPTVSKLLLGNPNWTIPIGQQKLDKLLVNQLEHWHNSTPVSVSVSVNVCQCPNSCQWHLEWVLTPCCHCQLTRGEVLSQVWHLVQHQFDASLTLGWHYRFSVWQWPVMASNKLKGKIFPNCYVDHGRVILCFM